MGISVIEIKNVKGIKGKTFQVNLIENKPNLLIASNGFGKSSIATAFGSLNSQRMVLSKKDHFQEDVTKLPEMAVEFNGQRFIADTTRNEINPYFDVTVIRNGLVPKATKRNMGKFVQTSASLEVESISIRKIPKKTAFNYQVKIQRTNFGANGKILPNITGLLQNPGLVRALTGLDLNKLKGVKINREVSDLVNQINQQTGTNVKIIQWISDNLLKEFYTINILKDIAANLIRQNLASTDTEAFLSAYQISELFKSDKKSFDDAVDWLQYIREYNSYNNLIKSFRSSHWQWAKLTEAEDILSVNFPPAHQLSNGQRDLITLVVQMHKALYEGSKKPLILIIDEVFDYLDDANLVAFQYYVTTLIEAYKQHKQSVYPIILTHLDPGIFFDFCFNKQKIHICYLQSKSSGKSDEMLKLIQARDNVIIKENLDKHWFHFHPDDHEEESTNWPTNLRADWRVSNKFHEYSSAELNRYLEGKNYDALAVCIAVRVLIEQNVYKLLINNTQKREFLDTHKTKEKLNFAAIHVLEIPETYFLLGLIHNSNLHWNPGKDYITPLSNKLSHPVIKKLIQNLNPR
ncbi:ATP-binding cassette domain-containing protein [Sphaerochaeta sp.]|uniref:ATP-binding cassette domain-containing protein n=1 Tax=Sphaerochaeta sp. TaxID=1972642 RepID=UPI002FC67591